MATTSLPFVYHDGGRAEAGYRGACGDCVCRSIAIASGRPYAEVYAALNDAARGERRSRRRRGKRSSAREGVFAPTIRRLLVSWGWTWTPTMAIGSGCTVHVRQGEVPPAGRHILALSRHLVALVDGVLYDTSDPSRDGTRCVYGLFTTPPMATVETTL